MKSYKLFLFFPILAFFLYFMIMLFHLQFFVLPISFFFAGFLIRVICKSNYLIFFTFVFPLASGFAFLENRGFPFNYFLLPMILFSGTYIGDLLFNRKKAFQVIKSINYYYLLLLSIIYISFIFIFLRWSNITLSLRAFLKNTPVAPDMRISFAIIFPVIYLFLFGFSYIYFLYLKEIEDKRKIISAFLLGHSISILFSIAQNIFAMKLFLSKPCNGLASDTTSFGFLCAVSLLLSIYLYFEYGDHAHGIAFYIISFVGILNSHTRVGLITFFFTVLLFLLKLKRKELIIFFILFIILVAGFTYLLSNPELSDNIPFLKELRKNILYFNEFMSSGEKEVIFGRKFLAGREQTWIYSFKILKNYTLSGVGLGNFIFWVMFDQYGRDYFHDLPCSEYLSFSSSIGIIGLLIFLLFIYSLWKEKNGLDKWIFLCILIILLFQNYFWIPECFLAFWLISSLGIKEKKQKTEKSMISLGISLLLIGCFIFFNLYYFKALHPLEWSRKTNTDYDYGLWYDEKDPSGEKFNWTKQKSGFFAYLNGEGESRKIKLFCGAPFDRLNEKKQEVDIYWKGKLYKSITFRENKAFVFSIVGVSGTGGFLEFRVRPSFNLKKMGIGEETRDLGIQLFRIL